MNPVDTDVLIVGGGPTGLALATYLQQAGVRHLLVDALPGGLNTSRAAVIHAHTLEMLDKLGVVAELQAQSLPLSKFTIRDRDEALLQITFDELPTAFRHILMLPQPQTEAILSARLEALGGIVRRDVKATGAVQESDQVVVQVERNGREEEVRARFVVGADGMHSTIRGATNIQFEGEAYGESFVLADVRMDWPLGQSEVSLCFSPAGLVVVAPLPDGSFRIVATMDDAPETPSIEHIQKLLDDRGPVSAPARIESIGWSSRFRVHHRLASSYRDGRILLMGDAAHVHSPAGGQGMNTGLVDAIVLGEALTAVVQDGAPLSVLDDYAQARRPAASEVLALASRLTRVATVRPVFLRLMRNIVLRLLNRLPRFKNKMALQLSGLSRRNLSVLPRTEGQQAVDDARVSQPEVHRNWDALLEPVRKAA
jgi:2-polyprenyl-6-methoxyphenol hydroxylase-like FAD-dependent oxidoreductase